MHVMVAVHQQGFANRIEDSGLMAVEVVRKDEFQRRAGFPLMLIVPVRVVPAAAVDDLLSGETEEKQILFPGLLGDLDRRSVAVCRW